MASPRTQKAINRYAAIVIPGILAGICGYGTWVVIVKVAIYYLLDPSAQLREDYKIQPRQAAGIAVIVLYFILLTLTAIPYFRTLYVIHCNPGLIPCTQESEKGTSNGLEYFYSKDAFICDHQGKPIWCNKCNNWKPDRTHHCSEIDRCVRRMDHYCPWVGGIVSETNMKFFIQFCSYGALYNSFILITMAVLLAERKRKMHEVDVHWAVTLGLGGLFALFSIGMAGSSLHLSACNLTTIENLNKGNAVYNIAVLVRHCGPTPHVPYVYGYPANMVTYPVQQQIHQDGRRSTLPPIERTYTVLQTQPGENPWDIGTLGNMKSVLGEKWYDWLLPIKYSPCTKHDRGDGEFEFGLVLERLKRDAGLPSSTDSTERSEHRRHRRHRRQQHEGKSRTSRCRSRNRPPARSQQPR